MERYSNLMDKEEIMVSVFCAVFNHGLYVRKALESFVMQKTDFTFEVIVHDDASTDNSREIIREFEEKYPDIIKPIYQTENQYSKGVRITSQVMLPKARGRYFAWCEGDDCWTDNRKLQKQVDSLRAHPNCYLCAHVVPIEQNGITVGKFPAKEYQTGVYSTLEALEMGYLQTSSLMIEAEHYRSYAELANRKAEIWGSEAIQMYMKLAGDTFFMNEEMSLYRQFTPGSWTATQKTDKEKQIHNRLRYIKMLETFQNLSDELYHGFYRKAINTEVVNYLILKDEHRCLMKKEYKNVRKMLFLKNRIKESLWAVSPKLYYCLIHKVGK